MLCISSHAFLSVQHKLLKEIRSANPQEADLWGLRHAFSQLRKQIYCPKTLALGGKFGGGTKNVCIVFQKSGIAELI